jgi:hypothetical protein
MVILIKPVVKRCFTRPVDNNGESGQLNELVARWASSSTLTKRMIHFRWTIGNQPQGTAVHVYHSQCRATYQLNASDSCCDFVHVHVPLSIH